MANRAEEPEAAVVPIGDKRHGSVRVISDLGFGYIVEERTNRRFGLSREAIGAALFSRLSVGDHVVFWENGHNAVAALDES